MNFHIALVVALIGLLFSQFSYAEKTEKRMFGAGSGFSADKLPPGRLKSRLNSLPPQAQQKAKSWLNSFSFPEADIEQLEIDESGGVFYADAFATESVSTSGGDVSPSGISIADVFSLHSKPGASAVLFIDVDGHIISNTKWNLSGTDEYVAQPFDSDQNLTGFSSEELDQIAEIWSRVAEDYQIYDIDVTTEDPGIMAPNILHALVTSRIDANGIQMPAYFAGGIAYANIFGTSDSAFHSPTFIYHDNLSDYTPFIAEAVSHEIGHNLGLSHDGSADLSYYTGHGDGATSWAPIMGLSYGSNVTQWSMGEYPGANNDQNDIALLLEKLGAKDDDHADTISSATRLQIESDGSVVSFTPKTDPQGIIDQNRGVINSGSDTDMFGFTANSPGLMELSINPSWHTWSRSNDRGTNLDIEATLYDQHGEIILKSDPDGETNATLSVNLSAGEYYIGIRGVGNSSSPYSNYGSQGNFYITGTLPVGSSDQSHIDTMAPTPDPMTFAVDPVAIDASSVTMTAKSASDDSGSNVQYYFSSAQAGSSGWQFSPTYVANGLSAATLYSWQVKARDEAGNETNLSASVSATTYTEQIPPASIDPVSDLVVSENSANSVLLVWSDLPNETGYQVYRERWHSKRSRWQSRTLVAFLDPNVTEYIDAGVGGELRYFIRSVHDTKTADSVWVEVTLQNKGGRANK